MPVCVYWARIGRRDKSRSVFMFQENILLKNHSHYKIGGPARYFFEAKNSNEVIKAVEKAHQLKVPIFILGGGSNVLFSDEGFKGLILKPNINFIEKEKKSVKVGTGVSMGELTDFLVAENLSGLEWAAGMPGTIGGAIRGNAGAFGSEMKNVVREVISLGISGSSPKIIKRKKQEADFGYRSSIFKKNKGKEIILEVILDLEEGDRETMASVIGKNVDYREHNQPLEYPSLGSTFKNVDLKKVPKKQLKNFESVIKCDPFDVVPAACLISEAGLKGISYGGAMISPKHPNFIVNVLDATADDVKELISLAKSEVYKKFNIELEEEIESL